MEYIYTFKCKACGKSFQESRDTPYKSVRRSKLCRECKINTKTDKIACVAGGFNSYKRCENCVSFHSDKLGWGLCDKGFYSESTKTLVYYLDNCSKFEAEDGED